MNRGEREIYNNHLGDTPGVGFEPTRGVSPTGSPGLAIHYSGLRSRFLTYLSRYSRLTARGMLSYLDRYLSGRVIAEPLDVMRIFDGLTPGQRHQLDRALRAFLNFCVMLGYPED